MPNDDICSACNRETPPRCKGKKKKEKISWICCDACSRWFHSTCMKISDALMERIAEYQYFCESCRVLGLLVPKSQPTVSTVDEVDELKKTVRELSAQLAKLQVEIESVRATNRKQIDRIQNKIRADRPEAPQNRLTSNLDVKLEAIENGAQLASSCSRTVNSSRLAINKIPSNEGENVNAIVENVLSLLDCQEEMTKVTSCFRLPVKPSKWTDRSLTPTIVVVFSNFESRQAVLRSYFEQYKKAKLRNLRNGPSLDYRFTINEVLSINTFRIRNHALRLKQRCVVKSVFVRNDKVSVLLPGQKRYVPVDTFEQLQELAASESGRRCSSMPCLLMSRPLSLSRAADALRR